MPARPLAAARRLGLVVDGDVFGPRHFGGILAALATKGLLRKGYVFGARPAEWPPLVDVLVPRRYGGKDPNDIAMSLEAARLVFQEKLDGIALAATDLDFLYLLEPRSVP